MSIFQNLAISVCARCDARQELVVLVLVEPPIWEIKSIVWLGFCGSSLPA